MTVVVTAHFEAHEGHEQNLIDVLSESIPAIHAEPGCLMFALHTAENGVLVLIEMWDSEEFLDTHLAGDPAAVLVDRVKPHIAKSPEGVRLKAAILGRFSRGPPASPLLSDTATRTKSVTNSAHRGKK